MECPTFQIYLFVHSVISPVSLLLRFSANLFFLPNKTFYLSQLKVRILNRFFDWLLISISSFNFSTCLISRSFSRTTDFTKKLHEFSQFQLGLLQHFCVSNEDIMERISRLASHFYVSSSAVWNQFIDHVFPVICLHLQGRNFYHLLPDLADLLVLSVGGLLKIIEFFKQNQRGRDKVNNPW